MVDVVNRNIRLTNEIFIKSFDKDTKEVIKELLHQRGIDLDMLKYDQNMDDVDDFDFICHVAFNAKPLTRKERADKVRKCDFFNQYSGAAREVLEENGFTNIIETTAGATITSHCGPGTLGVLYINDSE